MIANTKRNFSQYLIYFLVYFLVYFLGVQEPSSLSHASRHVTQNCYTRLCVDICYIVIQVYEELFTVMLACGASDSDRSARDASKSGKKKLEKRGLRREISLVRVFSLSLSLVRVFSLSLSCVSSLSRACLLSLSRACLLSLALLEFLSSACYAGYCYVWFLCSGFYISIFVRIQRN